MPIRPHRSTNRPTTLYSFTASPMPEHPGQDPGRDAGRGQGRLLGGLRHRGPQDPARAQAGGDHRRPDQRDGRPVLRHLPLGDEMPDHRPRRTDRLPAVPRRAPPPHPALQLHRENVRRDPPPGQVHRPAPRRPPPPPPPPAPPAPPPPPPPRPH